MPTPKKSKPAPIVFVSGFKIVDGGDDFSLVSQTDGRTHVLIPYRPTGSRAAAYVDRLPYGKAKALSVKLAKAIVLLS